MKFIYLKGKKEDVYVNVDHINVIMVKGTSAIFKMKDGSCDLHSDMTEEGLKVLNKQLTA